MNGQLQNSVVDYTYDGAINSKLVVRNLSRIHQHAVYTCQASNFHKKYVATNITIDLYREYKNASFVKWNINKKKVYTLYNVHGPLLKAANQ